MNKKLVKTGIIGTVLAAICCFTPVLVIVFGALGLSALTGFIDVVLLPILGICILLIVIGLFRRQKKAP